MLYKNLVTFLVLIVIQFVCGNSNSNGFNNVTETNLDDQQHHERSLSEADEWKALIKKLFEKYDARIAPNAGLAVNESGSTNITVQLFILSIDSISETSMDFAMSMFLRQSWYDRRLKYNKPGTKLLELDVETMSKVWVPDLFIPSEKKAHIHHVTIPNKLMHIYPDGRIQYSLRMSATIKCNFDLRKFPMDKQHCAVEMESYGYTTDTMRLQWSDTPVQYAPDMQIPQFYLDDLTTSQCDKIYYGVGYSCVRFDIYMERSKGYYITQVYIPSYLIVFLSWVSFWLDIEAVPARISLGLLTVLTMTTQSAGARNNLPKVSYLKAIDVWMAVCLVFVFLALVQFAYVNVLARVEKRRRLTTCANVGLGSALSAVSSPIVSSPVSPDDAPEKSAPSQSPLARMRKVAVRLNNPPQQQVNDVELGNGETPKLAFTEVVKKAQDRVRSLISADREKARNADRISRAIFPLAFLMFNIFYWCFYTFWNPIHSPH